MAAELTNSFGFKANGPLGFFGNYLRGRLSHGFSPMNVRWEETQTPSSGRVVAAGLFQTDINTWISSSIRFEGTCLAKCETRGGIINHADRCGYVTPTESC